MLFIYIALAAILFAMASHGLMTSLHLLRKILALNILSSAVFLVLVGTAQMTDPLDPVPHAMVITGIVVALAATAFAIALSRKIYSRTGKANLSNSEDRE
jgi:multicomponent Na+:H+ antiporter subunit C